MTSLALVLLAPLPAHASLTSDPDPETPSALVLTDDVHEILGTNPLGSYSRSHGLNVLVNDRGPDGPGGLDLCGYSVPEDAPLRVSVTPVYASQAPGWFSIFSTRNTTGSYDITYDACLGEERASATLTVNVTRVRPVKAVVARRPGRVRFVNRSAFEFDVSYGRPSRSSTFGFRPQGNVAIPPGRSAVVRVTTRRVGYKALVPAEGYSDGGQGVVRGVRLVKPRG